MKNNSEKFHWLTSELFVRSQHYHECRRTPEGRKFRRTFRRRHSEEECRLPLKLLEREGRGPRRKQVKHLPDVPRLIETTRRRAALKDALNESRDERMASDGVSIERRKRRREDGPMEPDRPKGPPSIEHVAEVVEDNPQSDARERKCSGT